MPRGSIDDLLRGSVPPQKVPSILDYLTTNPNGNKQQSPVFNSIPPLKRDLIDDKLKQQFLRDIERAIADAAGIPDAARLPQGGGHVVQHLPQAPEPGEDASGDAAHEAPHSHQPISYPPVADEQRGKDRAAVELLIRKIDADTLTDTAEEPPRAYIGASTIGSPCQAYLALNLRGFPNDRPEAFVQRIFDEGHRIEPYVVGVLTRAGLKIREVDPATRKQYHFEMYGGHLAANLDGMLWKQRPMSEPPTHTLEIKSMQRKLFVTFVNKGVAHSHPDYYDQMQLGLGMAEMKACLFVAYCKDNSKFHMEFVYFDQARYDLLVARAASAMFAEKGERHETFDCSMCFKRSACDAARDSVNPTRDHCRKCRHAMPDIVTGGKAWTCKKTGAPATAPCGEFETYQTITITPYKKGKK